MGCFPRTRLVVGRFSTIQLPKEITVNLNIRLFRDEDLDAIVELSLLAWEPVFQSFVQMLGHNIYALIWPDWHVSQAQGVASACKDREKYTTLVAEVDGAVAGFLVYTLNQEEKTGYVDLLAVHPDYQNCGIGTALNNAALDRMKESGMMLASVETGGDPGHAPARRSYEKAGYTGLPIVRYFKDLTTMQN
jgi:ribosomal protein S18 acetylase RimI-like enzyme